jgi:hypothetical protein
MDKLMICPNVYILSPILSASHENIDRTLLTMVRIILQEVTLKTVSNNL